MLSICSAAVKHAFDETLKSGIYIMETKVIKDQNKEKNIELKIKVDDSEKLFYYYEPLLHCLLKTVNKTKITEFYMMPDPGVEDSAYIVGKSTNSQFFILKNHLKGLQKNGLEYKGSMFT